VRPGYLVLEGFRSYERRTEFDLNGRNFIAIVGPTGTGKSSILDGIAYALYGKTPRVKTGMKRLICTRSDAAKVQLRFQIDDDGYEITRSLPRNGSGEHLLVEASSGDKTIGADAVTARVEELLSLDFDAFCSSVLLAQNKFSRFLDAATTERMKILKGVFRFEQIDDLRSAAKRRVGDLELELRGVEGERRGIPEDAPERLKEAKRTAKEHTARAAALAAAIPEEKQLEESIAGAVAEAEKAAAEARRATETLARIPEPAELDALATEEKDVTRRVSEGRKALEAASKAADVAVKVVADLEAKVGTETALSGARSKAEARVDLLEELATVKGERDTETKDAAQGAKELAAAEKLEKKAVAAYEASRDARRAAERAHQAHALRGTLSAGQPCPVCEQLVKTLPKGKAPQALGRSEAAEKKADEALDAARASTERVRSAVTAADARVKALTKEHDRASKRLVALDAELAAVVGKAKDPLAEVNGRLERVGEARRSEAVALAAKGDALSALTSCEEVETAFVTRRHRVAALLIEVAGRTELTAPAIEDASDVLARRAGEARSALTTLADDAGATLEKARTSQAEASAALAGVRARFELGPGITIDSARADATAEATVAERLAGDLLEAIERDKELAAQASELTARKRLFEQLAEDLTDRFFIKFLLEDRRRLLSELSSERLRDMTGRYRFDDEGEFSVIDELDGDKSRDVVTLSGGETFLASLSLALGLAEAVGRHGGRLQCFFLDEGFGSLDPESFDLALDGIEKLVTPDRLIGLVSHVQALATRVEDKIVLDKDADGISVVVSGGG